MRHAPGPPPRSRPRAAARPSCGRASGPSGQRAVDRRPTARSAVVRRRRRAARAGGGSSRAFRRAVSACSQPWSSARDEVQRAAHQPGRRRASRPRAPRRRPPRGPAAPRARSASRAARRSCAWTASRCATAARGVRAPPASSCAAARRRAQASAARRPRSLRDEDAVAEVELRRARAGPRCAPPTRRSPGRRGAPRPSRPPRRPAAARRRRCWPARPGPGRPRDGASRRIRKPSRQSCGIGTAISRVAPSAARTRSNDVVGSRGERRAGSRATSQNASRNAGSHWKTTARRPTRRSSRSPPSRSAQWWSDSTAIAASNAPSANGSASARASTHGAAPGGRCARITADGSTAVTSRSRGS